MKRLILMGGRPWLARDKGRGLVETLLRDTAPTVRIGMCIFAQPQSDWEETRKINAAMIAQFAGNTNVDIKVMTPQGFVETSAWANVIYMPGGDTRVLKKALGNYDIAKLWDGKTIAGASAGAHVLCKRGVYLQDRQIVNGFGWVNASVVVHWRSPDFAGFTADDWDWAEKTLAEPAGGMPLICIAEDKFVEVSMV